MATFEGGATVHDESPPTSTAPSTGAGSPSRSRVWTRLAAGAVLVFVLGMVGGWLLADGGGDATWTGGVDDAAATDIDALLRDYWVGWDSGDGEAIVALMTANGTFTSNFTAPGGYSGDELVDYVEGYEPLDFTAVGPTTVVETSIGYEVTGAERVDNYGPDPLWALDHFVIVEQDGELRIASHEVVSTHY